MCRKMRLRNVSTWLKERIYYTWLHKTCTSTSKRNDVVCSCTSNVRDYKYMSIVHRNFIIFFNFDGNTCSILHLGER